MSQSVNQKNAKNAKSDQSVIKDEATEILEEDRDTGNLMDAEDNPGAVHLMDEEFIEDVQADDYPRGSGEDPTVLMKVYVSTATKTLSSADIKKFLNIRDIKVMEVNQPEWMLCAEMRVCDQEDRDKVLALNRQTVAGFRIKFEVDGETPDQKLKPSVGLVKAAEMYVVKAEGLSAEATVKDFQELFPTVKEVRLPIAQAGEKRIALLDFSTKEEAEKIVSTKQGIQLHKQPLKLEVQKSLAPSSVLPSLTSADTTTADDNKKVLFVGNLLYETTEQTVKNYFNTCVKVRLLKFGDKQRSKGMGFVHFKTAADALQALIDKKDTELEGRRILLQFADGERRTAEDYRNKPVNSRAQGRDRSKPYSTPYRDSPSGSRWYSRQEVEEGKSFSKETGRIAGRGRGRGLLYRTGDLGRGVQNEKRITGRGTNYGDSTGYGHVAVGRGTRYEQLAMGRSTSPGTGATRRGTSYEMGSMGRGTSFRQRAMGGGTSSLPGAVGRGSSYGLERAHYFGHGVTGRGTRYNHETRAEAGYDPGPVPEGYGRGLRDRHNTKDYSVGLIPGDEFGSGAALKGALQVGIERGPRAGMIGRGRDVLSDDALYSYAGVGDEGLDLQEELERTRRLERKLSLAMEEKRRKLSQRAMARQEFESDRYGEFDGRFTDSAYSW